MAKLFLLRFIGRGIIYTMLHFPCLFVSAYVMSAKHISIEIHHHSPDSCHCLYDRYHHNQDSVRHFYAYALTAAESALIKICHHHHHHYNHRLHKTNRTAPKPKYHLLQAYISNEVTPSFGLTLRRLMSYIYGAPILDVSRSHTTTQHSR